MAAAFVAGLSLFAAAAVLSREDQLVLGLLAGGLTMTVLLSLSLARSIGATARQMVPAARGLARGEVEQEITVHTDDDLGHIADAFREMIAYQADMAGVADAISRRDLTAEIVPKSERDVFGHAFLRMRDSLRETLDQLERQALYDTLTGLANRTLLGDRIDHALRSARRTGAPLALLVLDLDRFKDVNDTFGHHHGDLLLTQVGDRFATALRDCDTLARMGGDEFAAVIPGADLPAAVAVAERMLESLREPFALEGREVESCVSIGIAIAPTHGEDAATLLQHADVAMYLAKNGHLGYAVYAEEHDRNSAERLALIADLRHAVAGDGLALHYQPQLDYVTGRVESAEALARWEHPTHGNIPPDVFIPLAEETGLIAALTKWVLNAALEQAAAWARDALPIKVAVNLSAHNLRDASLPDAVAEMLGRWDVPADRLVLEITETALMIDPERALETVEALRGLGIAIAIDDFGTGYSSLAYLKRLPAVELKIDRAFVRRMTHDTEDAAIVRSTIALAHELGLRVVGEGVEDSQTLEMLGRLGCDIAQGYYLNRPQPAAELSTWLRSAAVRPTMLSAIPT
jgi:diguanylate cyclase (GGDEF)-like protein